MKGQDGENFKILHYLKHSPKTNIWSQEKCKWEWKRLDDEELHTLLRSLSTFSVIRSRILRWVGLLARMEEVWSTSKF